MDTKININVNFNDVALWRQNYLSLSNYLLYLYEPQIYLFNFDLNLITALIHQ